jgi:predicted alpha/beta hydrolase
MQNDFMIDCEDGKRLGATHFGNEGKPAVIVSSAVGTQRGYYSKFAMKKRTSPLAPTRFW